MRVLHVIGGLELGGAETLLYRLATHPTPDVEHEVICLGNRDWYSPLFEEHGITVHHLGMTTALSALPALGRLRRLIRDRRADVVHSWMYVANVLSGVLARGTGIPVVWGIHASTFDHLGLPSRICAHAGGSFAGQLCRFVINCSTRSAEAHARFGYSAVPHAVIPNGYDQTAWFADCELRQTTRDSLGFERDTFVVGCITRWHPEKDVPSLLRAMQVLRARQVPLRCLLIGPGLDGSNAELGRSVHHAALEDAVLPLGVRGDVAALARAMDLHVLPSRSEAFPNVVAETMLSATPNAVTDVGDSAMIVRGSGWTVPPGEPDKMAEAIETAFHEWRDRPDDWERRRAAARHSIVERFTFERMVTAYQHVWREVAGKGAKCSRR